MGRLRTSRAALGLSGVVALVMAISVQSWGQVTQVQDGRALDANYGVGSGGINAPRPPDVLDSQLYITGQVTGLSRFRGGVGYTAADELRLNLPSSRLETFRQQSVGVADAVGGTAYRTSPYYDRMRTTFSVPRIVAGDAAPGSSMPMSNTVPSATAAKLYRDATAEYGSLATLKPEHMASATPLVRSPISSPLETDGLRSPLSEPADEAFRSLGQFGITRPGEQQAEAAQGEQDTQIQSRVELKVDTSVETKVPPIPAAVAAPEQKSDVTRGQGQEFLPLEIEEILKDLDYRSDQDIFMDMLVRLSELKAGRPLAGSPAEAKAPPSAASAAGSAGRRQGIVEIVDKGLVIHGLAGNVRNSLNVVMSSAAQSLKEGRFYEAAAAYEVAIGLAPANPLPRVGAAMSLLAAGEPYNSSLFLRNAMELLPPIMEMQVDLPEIFGPQLGVLKSRLSALDERVEEPPSAAATLRFLAAYVHAQLGQAEAARTHANKLKEAAGDDEFLSAYAAFVLTGRKPAEQKLPAKQEGAK